MALIKSYYKVYHVEPEPDYFYVKNESASNGNFYVYLSTKNFNVGDAEYKKENGQWTKLNYGATNTISIAPQEKVFLRATNWGRNASSGGDQIWCNRQISIGGNIMSINDYTNMNAKSIKNNLCREMFTGDNIVSVDFTLGNAEKIGKFSLYAMCRKCKKITSGPDFSKIKFIDEHGCESMFQWCSAFSTTPDFSSLQEVRDNGLKDTFTTTLLTETPDFSNVKIVSNFGFQGTFSGCANLSYAVAPSVSTWNTSRFENWLDGVAANGVVNKPANLTIPLNSTSGVPSGWTTEDRE